MGNLWQRPTHGLDVLSFKTRLKPLVLNVLDFLGVEHSYTRDPEIFQSMKRLALPTAQTGAGPKVLVLSFRGAWLLHGAWEALIAESIRRRGGRPTLFACSGGLPRPLPGKSPRAVNKLMRRQVVVFEQSAEPFPTGRVPRLGHALLSSG